MSAAILPFRPAKSVEEAWGRYCELVDERHERNLWKDLEHNQRIAKAWQDWSELYLAEERKR